MQKLNFDLGLKEYEIGGGVLRFNPGDPNVYARFLEAVEKLKTAEEELTRQEVALQLNALRAGDITDAELTAAKEALLSSLRGTHDSPGAIEGYYATAALSGLPLSPENYAQAVEQATAEDVAKVADIDLTDKNFWRAALQTIADQIDLFCSLVEG